MPPFSAVFELSSLDGTNGFQIHGDVALDRSGFSIAAVAGFTADDITAPNGALTDLATAQGGVTWMASYTPDAGVTYAANVISAAMTGVSDVAGTRGRTL